MTELFLEGADESSPLLVAIHGMGDDPARWVEPWRAFPGRVHLALPRAFHRHGGGFSWFQFEPGMTDAQFGQAVGAAEARLWRGIAKLARARRVLVTGFSQGGILSFAMAARRASELIGAFPVAGSCPGPLLPDEGAPSAPVRAFHGTADQVLEIKWARETVRAFKARGSDAELREYEGLGHSISPELRAELWRAIGDALPG